ncbi:MAG: CAP domain-containing protein [Candidatus Woesebacteria bacterium]|jgi:hypothetical protein
MVKQKTVLRSKKTTTSLHKKRLGWFAVLAAGLVVIHLAYNFRLNQPKLFGYATDISAKSLLEQINATRQDKYQLPLASSESLTKAAQSKAQDMIAKNSWNNDKTLPAAHFLNNYNYTTTSLAESLAYGFTSTDEVVSGWLSSEIQKNNIYGDFKEVGFGIAESDNYQGGGNVVVVAFYSNSNPANPLTQPAAINNSFAQVSGLTTITSGGATWATYASLGLIGAAMVGFFVTHLELIRLGWYKGRHFMLIHPLFDIAVIVSLALLMVYAVQGFIG